MQRLTVEIFAYLTYLFLLTVIARNNSDIYRFLWTNNIQNFLNSGPTAVEEVKMFVYLSSHPTNHPSI